MREPKMTWGKQMRSCRHLFWVHASGQQSNLINFGQSMKHCSAMKSPISAVDWTSCRFGQKEQICHLLNEETLGTPHKFKLRRDLWRPICCNASINVSMSKFGQCTSCRDCKFGSSCMKYLCVKAGDSIDKVTNFSILHSNPCGRDCTWAWTEPVRLKEMCWTLCANWPIASRVLLVKHQFVCISTLNHIFLSSTKPWKRWCAAARLNNDRGSRCLATSTMISPGMASSCKGISEHYFLLTGVQYVCQCNLSSITFTNSWIAHVLHFFPWSTNNLMKRNSNRIKTDTCNKDTWSIRGWKKMLASHLCQETNQLLFHNFILIVHFLCSSILWRQLALPPRNVSWQKSNNKTTTNNVSTLTDAFRYVNTLSDWFILEVSFFVLEGTTASCEPAGDWSSTFAVLSLVGPKLEIVSGFMEGRAPVKKISGLWISGLH